jgi:hypothetical protein
LKKETMTQLNFWLEERPVNRLASPDSEEDWLTNVATWRSSISGLLRDYGLGGSSGKTSLGFCHREEDGTLVPLSGRWANSGMGSPTECWTLNSCEWTVTLAPSRSDGGVSSLLDILETGDVPQRYFLSPRAAAGILRRAERRSSKMPEFLLRALREVTKRA